MADPSQQAAAGPGGGADQTYDSPLRSFYGDAVQHNAKTVSYIRSTTLSIAGGIAGVLGLTNLAGFYFYFFAQLLVSLAIILLNARAQPSKFLLDPAVMRVKSRNAKVREKTKAVSPQQGHSADQAGPGAQAWMWIKLIFMEGAQENVLSYILWWTFWYGIVHVYD